MNDSEQITKQQLEKLVVELRHVYVTASAELSALEGEEESNG